MNETVTSSGYASVSDGAQDSFTWFAFITNIFIKPAICDSGPVRM